MPALIGRVRDPVISLSAALILWQVVAWSGSFDDRLLPSPISVLTALAELTVSPFAGANVWEHSAASLLRLFTGFLAAVAIAVPLGIAMATYPKVSAIASPYVDSLRAIPPLAWVPFAILWFGVGLTSSAFVIFTGVVAVVLLNTFQGVRDVPPVLINAARTLGARQHEVLREVTIPAAIPLIFAGLRIGLGIGWMSLIGAELVAAQSGLGFLIARAQTSLRSDMVIAGMISIGVIGALMDAILRAGSARLLAWREN